MSKSATTRKELIARANHWGLDVETHSPGGSGTYFTFGEPNAFNPRTMSWTYTEHGLSNADSFVDGFIFAQIKANARLIAAAPELLAAAIAIRDTMSIHTAPSAEAQEAIDAAIAKAEGRS